MKSRSPTAGILCFAHFLLLGIPGSATASGAVTDCMLRALEELRHSGGERFDHVKRPSFPQVDRYSEHRITYTRELPKIPPKDQCESTCWANAGASAVEYLARRPVTLSANYLIARTILRDFRDVLTGARQGMLEYANFPGAALRAVDLDGVVPESVFPSNRDVDYRQVIDALNRLLSRAGEVSATELYSNALRLVEANYGSFPRAFQYEGRTYTSPLDFRRDALLALSGAPKPIRGNMAEMESTVENVTRSIDRKKPILLSYDHIGEALDPKAALYSTDPQSSSAAKEAHIVVITGYRRDPATRKITHLKIKNSHGFPDTLHMPGWSTCSDTATASASLTDAA